MKLMCKSCGCHFPDQFEETLLPECTYWSAKGFPDDFPEKFKKAIWDAQCSIPYDAIACETGIIINDLDVEVQKDKTFKGNQFVDLIPEYHFWFDEKRKRFQQAWFKNYFNPEKGRDLWGQAMQIFEKTWDDPNKPDGEPDCDPNAK